MSTASSGLSLLVATFGAVVVIRDKAELAYGVTTAAKVLLVLPVLASVLTLGSALFALRLWMTGSGGLRGRLFYTAVTLASTALLWLASYWNLLGFRY